MLNDDGKYNSVSDIKVYVKPGLSLNSLNQGISHRSELSSLCGLCQEVGIPKH